MGRNSVLLYFEDDLNNEDNIKKEDKLKSEDDLKNEDNLKNEDDPKRKMLEETRGNYGSSGLEGFTSGHNLVFLRLLLSIKKRNALKDTLTM